MTKRKPKRMRTVKAWAVDWGPEYCLEIFASRRQAADRVRETRPMLGQCRLARVEIREVGR